MNEQKWMMVPVEPTPEIIEAGRRAIMSMLEPQSKRLPKPTIAELEAILNEGTRKVDLAPDGTLTELSPRTTNAKEVSEVVYRAMLSAAPNPPAVSLLQDAMNYETAHCLNHDCPGVRVRKAPAVAQGERESDRLQCELDDLLGPDAKDDDGHMSDEAQRWAIQSLRAIRRLEAALSPAAPPTAAGEGER